MSRSNIPSKLKRDVLVEAGHRCAIPTCRQIEVEIHHIIPWSDCQEHNYENLIALCANCHTRADKGEIDRQSLKFYKYNLRLAHDKFSQIEMDIMFQLYNLPKDKCIRYPIFMLFLVNRILDSGYVEYRETHNPVFISGMNMNPVDLWITDKGIDFIKSLENRRLC